MNARTLLLVGCLVVAGVVGTVGFGAAGPSAAGGGDSGALESAASVGTGDRAAEVDAARGGPAAVQESCSFPVTATDTTGTEVTVEERPERIVALQPSDAQALWEIGTQDRVVGMDRTQYTAYLSDRGDTTNVKNEDLTVNTEQVVGLQPDVVLAANTTSIETVRQLRSAGITVYHFGLVTSLDEVARNVETVGRLVGSCESARESATEFRLSVERAAVAAERADERPDALYYFFETTTGTGTHIHDVIETAGGNNVAADAGIEGYASLSEEIVVERDPDWIVSPDDATVPSTAAFNGTTAVREGQTVALRSNYISQPGVRVAVPLTRLARTWHPDALDAANESVNRSDVRENATTPTPAATTASGPGLTAAGAIAGLTLGFAAVVLLTRRRN
jgi:iron complex transport system substrate-binding protein